MKLEIKRLAHALAAEVRSIDGTRPLDAAGLRAVRDAWLTHKVLVFPNMQLTPAEHVAFSRQFGELETHLLPSVRHREHPEIMEVTNRPVDGKPSVTAKTGRQWHSDGAFTVRPPTGSLLHCRALPEVGGDTWFTDMVAAWEALTPQMQRMLEPLRVVNSLQKSPLRTRDPLQTDEENRRLIPAVVQPLVRLHPETGRKALYLSETVTTHIHGMTPEESEGLLHFLFQHSIRPEFTYRHRWRLWDIVMWDNRSTMHLAPGDYDTAQIRHMSRTTLAGEPLGELYEPASATPPRAAAVH